MNLRIGFCGACVSYGSFKRLGTDYDIIFKEERPIISLIRQNDDTISRLSNTELLENDIIIKDLSKNELQDELNNIDYLVMDLYYDFIYCSQSISQENTFTIWTENADNLLSYIQSNYPNLKIIFTEYKLHNAENSQISIKYNPLIEKLEGYLVENYDIDFVTSQGNGDTPDENLYYRIHSKILEEQIDTLKNNAQNNQNPVHNNTTMSDEEIYVMYNEINDFKENTYVYNKFNLLQSIKKENSDLKGQLQDKEEEIRQLVKFKEDVYSSLSWKITKPLRIAKKIRK